MPQTLISKNAAEFELKNQEGKTVKPMSLKGNRILLSFHPLAWTPVCEIQMRTLEIKKDELDHLDTLAYGISVDAVPTKQAWAESIGIKETNLLSDFMPRGAVAKMYDLFSEEHGFSKRANILLDPQRKIELIKIYDIPEIPDIEEIIRYIQSRKP
ncbi:MAG: redoxin domain-containing protein [Desulfococcaceae bacterium]|jgi:peroxiredoxin|nr:redoxin domain-containing protein [Desulfococcaceae bacterium]